MARANLDSTMAAAIASGNWMPVLLASLQFRSETALLCSGSGSLVWNGLTFTGAGSLGRVSVSGGESGTVSAQGAAVALSGIDTALLGEVTDDLLPNGAAALWLGAWTSAGLAGNPYQIFAGYISQVEVTPGIPTEQDPAGKDTFTIAMQLETSMKQLNRATRRRYTAADQRIYYPNDCGFNWVEMLQNIAERWG